MRLAVTMDLYGRSPRTEIGEERQVTEPIFLWMYKRVDAITTLERRSEELISSP